MLDLQFLSCLVEVFFELLHALQSPLLLRPAGGQRARFFFQLGELELKFFQTIFGRLVGFLFQGLALDLKLDDAPIELVQFFGLGIHLHPQAGASFVDEIDGFVRQEAIGDVTVRKRGRGDKRAIGDANTVMDLIFLLEPAQN